MFPSLISKCLCSSANLAIKYNTRKNTFFNKTLTGYFYQSQSRAKRPIIQFADAQVTIGSISAVSRVRSLILPEKRLSRGMSAGSFSRTAAGNRA